MNSNILSSILSWDTGSSLLCSGLFGYFNPSRLRASLNVAFTALIRHSCPSCLTGRLVSHPSSPPRWGIAQLLVVVVERSWNSEGRKPSRNLWGHDEESLGFSEHYGLVLCIMNQSWFSILQSPGLCFSLQFFSSREAAESSLLA